MSRGRGGGRGGRGGGAGGAMRDLIQPSAEMTLGQWHDALKKRPEHVGMLYPPLEAKSVSTIPAPLKSEETIIAYSHSLFAYLEKGTDQPGWTAPTPWRRTGEHKSIGIEIETYSGSNANLDGPTISKHLDPQAMFLDEKNFPKSLWAAAFEEGQGDDMAKRKKAQQDRQKKRRKLEDGEEGDNPGVSEDEAEIRSGNGSGSDEEGDFDFEDEEEDHQDYDANYFDNGEGDDDDDGAGDDDGGGGDTWD